MFTLSILLLCLIVVQKSASYPLITPVDEDDERCFRFNIPKHDDAHLVVVVVPTDEEIEEDVESWFVDQVYELTKLKNKKKGFPKTLPNEQPVKIANRVSDYLQKHKGADSGLELKITKSPSNERQVYDYTNKVHYFMPVVLNHLHVSLSGKGVLEGYGICLVNTDPERSVHVILDIVLNSEDVGIGEEKAKSPETDFQKEKHLTPIERSLDQSLNSANAILREMKYMEKREARMRHTADSINTRVRWFSYLSVAVLLTVTYLQVTYLKRYFHKKKLM
jgi:hypothetical protein